METTLSGRVLGGSRPTWRWNRPKQRACSPYGPALPQLRSTLLPPDSAHHSHRAPTDPYLPTSPRLRPHRSHMAPHCPTYRPESRTPRPLLPRRRRKKARSAGVTARRSAGWLRSRAEDKAGGTQRLRSGIRIENGGDRNAPFWLGEEQRRSAVRAAELEEVGCRGQPG